MGYLKKSIAKWKRSLQKRIIKLCAYDKSLIVKNILELKQRSFHYLVSYSQYGQDIFVKNYYASKPHKQKYYFVDIGANDGVSLSNTYMLEYFNISPFVGEHQDWGGGGLIEADSNVFKKLIENRPNPNTAKYNVALCDIDGEVEFMQINGGTQMLSGIVSQYDSRHLERIKREMEENETYEIVKVQGARFQSIMANHPEIKEIDYLSIDVEGGEMSILKAIDFNAIPINLIGIEDSYPDSSGIDDFLMQKGYRKICMLGCDSFFEKVR